MSTKQRKLRQKILKNTTLNYSPNFDPKKRKIKQIKFIIFHYTGMRKEADALTRLTDQRSKVSSHYFIKSNGQILTLIPETYIAWHAGISAWRNYKSINKFSIGIEISNPGHDNKYRAFTKKQINSIIKMSKYLIQKYNIASKFILGHSDIAPGRKKDPGEKFPWKKLSESKIGFWHNLDRKKMFNLRNKKIDELDKNNFIHNLYKIGYSRSVGKNNNRYLKKIVEAFQRRFRQELINGKIDKECLLISRNLVKKFK